MRKKKNEIIKREKHTGFFTGICSTIKLWVQMFEEKKERDFDENLFDRYSGRERYGKL